MAALLPQYNANLTKGLTYGPLFIINPLNMKTFLIFAISYENTWNPFLVSGENYQEAIQRFNQNIFPEFLKTQDPNNFTDDWEDWRFSIYPLLDVQETTLTEISLEYWPYSD